MRELYVVGLSDDGGYIELATRADAARGTHRVQVDDRLRAALHGFPPQGARTRVESALTPKEIQARLRAGESPEQVARVARVPVARILRYADPILSERARVIDLARSLRMTRLRRGESSLPLGEAVDLALAATSGLKPDTVEYAARRREDGAWVVGLAFTARGRARKADWLLDPATKTLVPLDALGSRLGYVEAPSAAKPAPKRRRAAPARAKAPARATPARAAKSTAARRGRQQPAAGRQGHEPEVIALRPRQPKAAGIRAAAAGRPAVPSWDDVLLGVRAPTPAEPRAKGGGGKPRRAR